jgi:DNA-binding MarR family transcriptional regulator
MGKKDKGEKKPGKGRKSGSVYDGPDLAAAVIQTARFFRTVQSRHLSDCGLYAGQDSVILLLQEEDGQTAGAIAQTLQVKPPTMTRTIARMQAEGFVERRDDAGDGRLTKVWLTEAGRKTVVPIRTAMLAVQQQASRSLSDKQCRSLIKILKVMDANLQAGDGLHDYDSDA